MALTEENNRRHLSSEPAFRNSHISQINEGGEQDRRSAAKRYGTYELNWTSSSAESISTDDDVIVDFDDNKLNIADSTQVAKKNLIKPKKHSSLQDTRKNFLLTSNKQSNSSFGIAVTTTKVIEVLGGPKEKIFNNDSSFIKNDDMINHSSINVEQRHSRQEKLNISSNINVEYERRRSIPSPPPPITTQIPPPPVPQMREKSRSSFIHDQILLQKQKNRISIGPVKSKGGKRKSLNFTKINQPEFTIPKESSFIDPRLLAKKNNYQNYPNYPVKTQTINRKLIKRDQSIRRNKIPPRNMEFAPTSNPILSNDPTDMDADLPPLKLNGFPWLPGPSKPPQLLHASLIPLPNRSQRTTISSNTNRRNSYISINKPGRVSNLISSVNVKRNSINFPQSRLNRVNSSRKRVSIMVPTTRRASLIFRQQILEESLMMSFGQQFPTSQPINSTKPLIRRKTKKGSNAKVEDREARRERRRRVKREKNIIEDVTFENSSNNNNLINRQVNVKMENTKKSLNGLEITKIIETPELLTNKENITTSQLSSRQYDQQLKIIDESNSINQIPPPLLSPRTQKLGILGGLFNKQSSGSPLNSPGIPSRAIRLPTSRVVKPRRTNDTTPTIQDPEKLRKMEQFEALIAKKKKKKTGPYIPNGRRHSSTSSNESDNSGEQQNNELKMGVEEPRSSLTSLATSVAESVHYRPEEKNKLGKPGPTDEDGVIRVTLTPKVCR
ncbi:1153_t:CDS:2 [Gigaspora rosea]|nr:1153_t:CDS:2 [Gigaspora rosea]